MKPDLISIILTGASGLVGSKFISDFDYKYDFINLDRRDPVTPADILDYNSIAKLLNSSNAQHVVHLAAFTDVTAAYTQNGDKSGPAYQINVLGTQNMVRACEKTNKHLIHISTAYVFDGEKESLYTEVDQPQPIEWYGQTKYEAEKLVTAANCPWTILRIDTPFRSDNFNKPDQARKILATITSHLPLFTDHYFGPTYLDDFSRVLDWVIRTNTTGLYHASSGEKWSDYEFGKLIAETKNLKSEIIKGSLAEYLKQTSRPYQHNTAMDASKLKSKLDFELTNIEKAISELEIN